MCVSLPDVAVVVVTYNSAEDLESCLLSVLAECPAEVIVADNASLDTSVEIAHKLGVTVSEAARNEGYGAAANRGVRLTTAPIVLILNPDVVIEPGTLQALSAHLAARPDVGVVGPQLRNPDGSIQQSCRVFPKVPTAAAHGFLGLFWKDNPISSRYTMANWNHDTQRDVDWVSGAAIALRRSAWAEVSGFDTGYFMYVEDVDLCWRVRQSGWRVTYEPTAVATHVIGTSSVGRPYRLLAEHHRSMLRFERVRRDGRRGLFWPIVVCGVWSRFAVAVAIRGCRTLLGRGPALRRHSNAPSVTAKVSQ